MATFLFDEVVFGPVISRRLGISLGINLLPIKTKLCNFNCIYCECGWNPEKFEGKDSLPTRQEVFARLENVLGKMKNEGKELDMITFAGNGEPTIHHNFAGIIDDTILLRNRFYPEVKISVLSNATMLHKPQIVEALKKVDQNILKLDSGFAETIAKNNLPAKRVDVEKLIEQFGKFEGKLIIQTMFVSGEYNNQKIDNTTEKEIDAWTLAIAKIRPEMVMIYTIARDTPTAGLQKICREKLQKIAAQVEKIGIATQVSG